MPLTVQSPPHQEPKKTDSDVQPRQEYLLMDKVQQEMKPGRKADTLTQESGSKEDYLKHQFEKQTQLYTEKIRGIIKEWDEKLTQAFKQYVQARRDRGQFPSGGSDTVWILGVLAGVYILYCLPFMLIARKLHFSGLMAWIPLLQLFLLTRVAGRPLLWLFLLLIPVINIFVLITLCMDIAKRLQRPSFLGFLLIVPGLNLFILWYFAFVRINPVFAPHALGEPIVRSGL